MRRYLAVLRKPDVGALYVAALLARLPLGINGLAIVLFVRERTGSFAAAGAATGAYALASGVGSPFQARLVDDHGPRRVLPWLVVLQSTAVGGFVAAGLVGAPAAGLVAVATLAGLGQAPWSSVLRATWPRLLGDDGLIQTAFALDAAVIEVVFIAGPLLTGIVAALASPQLVLLVSAGLGLAGMSLFVASAAIRAWQSQHHEDRHPLRALRSRGLRTVVLVTVPLGLGIGALEVAVPAFAVAHGRPAAAGVLLAVCSVGSACGALLYGAGDWSLPLPRRWVALTAALAAGLAPLLAAWSVPSMLVLLVPAGLALAPTIASGSQLLGTLATPGMGAEAYAWGQTALVVGISAGSAAAGALAQASSWRASIAFAVVTAAAGAAAAFAQRRTLGADYTAGLAAARA